MTEDKKTEDLQVPKHRLDEESAKRKELQARFDQLQKEFTALKNERESEESKKDEQRGEFEKIAERERKKREAAEEEARTLRTQMLRKDQRATFYDAARGVIRSEAVSDAFAMIPAEDLDATDASDTEAFKKMAQSLAESKTYLADAPRGSGAGNAERQVVLTGTAADKKPLPWGKFNRRRIN